MRKPILAAILAAILASLACGQYITPTPSVVSTVSPSPVSSDTPAVIPSVTLSPPPAAVSQTAIVRVALVNVRAEPDGAVLGNVKAGDMVTVLECVDKWCHIHTGEIEGWIWQGCLSNHPEALGCEAK